MGLLDSLLSPSTYGGQNGGLLDLLQNSLMQQNSYQPSAGFPQQQPGSGRSFDSATFDPATYAPTQPLNTIGVGGYQMPRIGNPDQFQPQQAMTPPNAQPTQGQISQQPPQQAQQPDQQQLPPALGGNSFGGNFGAGLQNFVNAGGPLQAIAGGISGLMTGQRTDAQGMAQQNLKAQYDSLVPIMGPQKAMLAVMNPEARKLLLDQYYGKDKFTPVKTKDMMGNETVSAFNTNDGTYKSSGAPAENQGGALGDMNKTGAEYLATVPKQQAGVLQGMVDGTIQPPSSFALAKPYWQAMLAAAKNVDPNFDANTWATRHKLSTDMAASGNSSMGGILANGKSAFSHLADLSGSMADLGNTSHDFPGGGTAAAVQNYLGNKTFAGSDTLAKIKAINDNLGHYGQESTKFYSGTGGGVEERMNALKEMNPTTTSSEEMASYLAKEKSLMMDRLKQKEAQIRDTMGDSYLKKHPILTSDLQQTLDTIDTNIEKLKGATKQPNSPSLPSGWSVQVH